MKFMQMLPHRIERESGYELARVITIGLRRMRR
jgi:hypothetical protein